MTLEVVISDSMTLTDTKLVHRETYDLIYYRRNLDDVE